MNINRVAIAVGIPLALCLSGLAAPVAAQPSTPTRFEQAMLAELDAPTRAEVERRAIGGNSVMGVIGTILLNNYQQAGPRRPGRALEVVAVDFGRGVAIIRRGPNAFEVQRFDPRTLRLQR